MSTNKATGCASSMSEKRFALIENKAMTLSNKTEDALLNTDYIKAAEALKAEAQTKLDTLLAIPVRVEPAVPPVAEASKAEPATPTTTTQTTTKVVPPEAAKTVKDAYPKLLGNILKDAATSLAAAFNLRKTPSRFLGSEFSPIETVVDVLGSTESLTDFLGKDSTKRTLSDGVLDFYTRKMPTLSKSILYSMSTNLNALLDEVPKDGDTLRNKLDRDVAVHDFPRGKALNIVERVQEPYVDADGKKIPGVYAYNQELVETAILGSLNWFMNASSSGAIYEAKDVAALMGILEDNVSQNLVDSLNSGDVLIKQDVIPRMSANIVEFWGMKANADYPQSSTVGMPQAVATEVLVAMISEGLVTEDLIGKGDKSLTTFKLNQKPLGEGYKTYPTLLAEMANSEIAEPMYFGDVLPPVAKTQMNNAAVALTTDQEGAVEKEQKTPFYLNPLMLSLYEKLGVTNLLTIFGAGELTEDDKKLYNETHLETVEGQNTSIRSAFTSVMGRVGEMRSIAEATGKSLDSVAARFAYGVSRVGRMQMLGKQNPQASKLVRELLMPNASTVDLSDPDTYNDYMLAIAQMLGVKVHIKSLAKSVAEATEMLNNPDKLKPLVDLLAKFDDISELDEDATDLFKKLMPLAGGTFMGLHAIVDYARLQNFRANNNAYPTEYKTSVYVEADGVTNGPVNAMMNLSAGRFTLKWLQNIAKGGMFMTPDMTLNEHRKTDSVDLYEEATARFKEARLQLRSALSADGVVDHMDTLMGLMSTFVKDITVTEDGEVILKRGVAKNPLTITIYGSGERGIANKITAELLDAIYAKMSEAMQKGAANPSLSVADAMFGDQGENNTSNKTPDELYDEFAIALAKLSSSFVARDKKTGVYYFADSESAPIAVTDLQTFKVEGDQLDVLQKNMLAMFVKPLREGIEETLGADVMETSKMLQVATQLQSMGLQAAFKEAVQEALVKLNRPTTHFLSKNEQAQILQELIVKFPTIKTKAQEFLVAGTSQSQVKASDFSSALSGKLVMPAAVFAPSDAGVAGAPYLNIGMGDGLMMQIMSLMPDAVEGTLKIFDGINLPVDKIREGSRQANTAVAQTWQGNPMRAVANSFRIAMPNIIKAMKTVEAIASKPQPAKATRSEKAAWERENAAAVQEIEAMQKVFKGIQLKDIDFQEGMEYVMAQVELMADQVEARHLTMQHFAHSIDQMASAQAPFNNEGEDISLLVPEAQVARMNEVYTSVYALVRAKTESKKEILAAIKTTTEVLKADELITPEGLLQEVNKLPDDLRDTARHALRSSSMREYVVYRGSPEYFTQATGIPYVDENSTVTEGAIDPTNKTIYLVGNKPEVLVHELVHAATLEKLQNIIEGNSTDAVAIAAVDRIRVLGKQLREMHANNATQFTPEQNIALNVVINSMNATTSEAAELNELMAWALSNQEVIDLGKQTKAAPGVFATITRSLINLIRQVFLGSSSVKVPKSFFDAVRFNTVLIANSTQPSAPIDMGGLIARHSTAYGNDARLNQIQKTYIDLVEPLFAGTANLNQKLATGVYAANLVNAVQTAFPMNQQEKSTFLTVVSALATEAKVNPASVAMSQSLYNHVTKQLTVEDFMDNPELQDPVDRYYAQAKYDMILGKSVNMTDAVGRSSLMPVFLALATTDEGFRGILSKMDMPKDAKKTGTTLDVYLRNYGTQAMEALANTLAGVSATDSVKQAIDGLQANIVAITAEKATLLDLTINKFGSWIVGANDYVVGTLGSVATKGAALGSKMDKSNNKYIAKSAGVVKVLAGSLINDKSDKFAEGILAGTNTLEKYQPLRDLVNDIIGRTASNATVYDMIKQVRATVASIRQEFRENVPLKLAKEFKTELSDESWTDLTRAAAMTDMVAVDLPFTEIVELVRNKAKMAQAIKAKEDQIKAVTGKASAVYLAKTLQLSNYMKTGKTGQNLLRNAHAISMLLLEKTKPVASTPELIKNIDELASLYAIRDMEQQERNTFNSLAQDEGLEFTFMYLKQQRADETTKALANEGSKLNHYKGHVPSVKSSGMSLIVADDTQSARLKAMSYERVGDYTGAGAEGTNVRRGYYFSNAPNKGRFEQGIVQNVNQTANGVSITHGFTQGLTAGVVTDPIYVAKLVARMKAGAEKGTKEHMMPVFNANGTVRGFERSVDPTQVKRLQSNDKLNQMLGVWQGRQVEEAMAEQVNNKLVDNLVEMHQADLKAGKANQYVNIFDPKDKVLIDALKLMPAAVKDYMISRTGNTDEFWVRRDMVFDAFGYRAASVGDAWTGNSRWSDETQKTFQRIALGVMGNKAFRVLTNAEKFIQGYAADARTTIVVKSVIVPVMNLASNVAQLAIRGVPLKDIARKAPAKAAEIEAYVKNRIRRIAADAELRAAKTNNAKIKLEAEIQSLNDTDRRLSIWPLIEAGEFTAISDVGLTHDDVDLSQGRWHEFVEKMVDKLPEAMRNAGRYAYITKDTALFQGLQKAVQYGDFLGKAILFEDLTERKKLSPKEAMAMVTEEFINYDRLPGRFRGYLEQMGLLWFYNFKLRSTKVAANMLRNNPVHALLGSFIPMPSMLGEIGSPIGDNALVKGIEGTLGYSVGPGMGLSAPTLNPWWQMAN
jgi:hypothetical protein